MEAERKVIGEERAREMESPQVRLDQTHQTMSYLKHPYRNPVLGWPEDVARIGVEDLRAFYREHYRPAGAVLVLAGDVEPAVAMERIEAHFGAIVGGRRPRAAMTFDEPVQRGRRDFTLIEAESLSRGLMGWHTVPRGHRDSPALDVLADLLCAGRRSRLWHALVEQEKLATWVEATHMPAQRAGQFFVQVECAPEAEPAELERRIAGILRELIEHGPTPQELARARSRLEAGWRWEQEDLAGLAAGIGHAALWGDWRDWQAEHAAALAVDAAAIRRVAARYLTEGNLTAGWSLPRQDLLARTGRLTGPAGQGGAQPDHDERRRREPDGSRAGRCRPGPSCPERQPRLRTSPRSSSPAAARGPSISGRVAPAWKMDCASSTSGGEEPGSSPWSFMSMPAGCARPDRAWPP